MQVIVFCLENYVSPTHITISHLCTENNDFSIVSQDLPLVGSHLQDEYYVVNNRPNTQ
jgi:hypothetical protein